MNNPISKNLFLEWLQAKNLSGRTISEYSNYFDKLDLDLTAQNMIRFINKNNNIVARAFLNNLLQYIRTGPFNEDIKTAAKEIQLPKITGRKKKKIPDVLTEDRVLHLSNKVKTKRERYMILITFYGGLRESELVGDYFIKPFSFNWKTWYNDPSKIGTLKVTGKGNKQRIVFIPQWLMSEMFQWIKNEISGSQKKEDKLFQIGTRRWRQILAKRSNDVLGKSIHPHVLRHSCNMWLKGLGWDVKERQKYLGHESPVTTMIYDHTDQEDIKKKFSEIKF